MSPALPIGLVLSLVTQLPVPPVSSLVIVMQLGNSSKDVTKHLCCGFFILVPTPKAITHSKVMTIIACHDGGG
jgi:hypothetical protein